MSTVFSNTRDNHAPRQAMPSQLGQWLNQRLKMDGRELLAAIPDCFIPAAFFDPQYRGILNKMGYGNEGEKRSQRRCALPQMETATIIDFMHALNRVLLPSGHLFLWLDKYELLNGVHQWRDGTTLAVVDLIGWDKQRMGMGYRTRRVTEYCLVLQKHPKRAKGVWQTHTIRDTWREKAAKTNHPHAKPIGLQTALIEAVTNAGDIVLDPAAGDFTVLEAANLAGRDFLGCDIVG